MINSCSKYGGYCFQQRTAVLDLTAATVGLVYSPEAGDQVGGVFGIIKIPTVMTNGYESLCDAKDVAKKVADCDWRGAGNAGWKLSEDLARTGYDANCVNNFAQTIGFTGLPSTTGFGTGCLGFASAHGAYKNLQVIFNENAPGIEVMCAASSLREREVSKNYWELGDSMSALIYCTLFFLGVTLTPVWVFLLALASVICTFGAYLQEFEITHSNQNI